MACVLPIIEYASTCWSPTSDKTNNLLEMVQHNAARFISNTYIRKGNLKKYSVTKVLKDLNLKTIEERRTQARLIMAYKIINSQVILQPNLLPKVNFKRPMGECNNFSKVGKEHQLIEPNPQIQVAGHTFFFSIQKIWNKKISTKQAKAPSAEAFKNYF